MIAGWRPRRTIIFASWDAEEFGLLGSTEWAEVNEKTVKSKAKLGSVLHVAAVPSIYS